MAAGKTNNILIKSDIANDVKIVFVDERIDRRVNTTILNTFDVKPKMHTKLDKIP